jgi:hypothetical protein
MLGNANSSKVGGHRTPLRKRGQKERSFSPWMDMVGFPALYSSQEKMSAMALGTPKILKKEGRRATLQLAIWGLFFFFLSFFFFFF